VEPTAFFFHMYFDFTKEMSLIRISLCAAAFSFLSLFFAKKKGYISVQTSFYYLVFEVPVLPRYSSICVAFFCTLSSLPTFNMMPMPLSGCPLSFTHSLTPSRIALPTKPVNSGTRKQIRKRTEKEGKEPPMRDAKPAASAAAADEIARLKAALQAEVEAAKSYRMSLQLALSDLDDEGRFPHTITITCTA
jgi:hypothetical protein